MDHSARPQGVRRPSGTARPPGHRLGVLCTVFGALAFASLVWIWMLSTLESFNPANWIRILGSVWLPLGLVGSLVTGFAGRHEGGRGWIAAGLSLSAVTLAGFLVLLSTAG